MKYTIFAIGLCAALYIQPKKNLMRLETLKMRPDTIQAQMEQPLGTNFYSTSTIRKGEKRYERRFYPNGRIEDIEL